MARLKTYLGPKTQIQPADLAKYEEAGIYVAEEKHDGHWAEVITGADGKICRITGRSGTVFSGVNVEGLVGLHVGLVNTTLIGELEAATEAANRRNSTMGHRRLWIFDMVRLLDQDTTSLVYEKRRELLETIFSQILHNSKRVKLVKQVTKGFNTLFDNISKDDGEGLVLKKLGRPYRPHGSDGKTDDWIRCKRYRYVDYIVTDIGKSEGGSPNFQVGLYIDGRLLRVGTIKNIPQGLDYASLVGKVIECKGAEVHDSGALRHGHFHRARPDKDNIECTLEAAIRS